MCWSHSFGRECEGKRAKKKIEETFLGHEESQTNPESITRMTAVGLSSGTLVPS